MLAKRAAVLSRPQKKSLPQAPSFTQTLVVNVVAVVAVLGMGLLLAMMFQGAAGTEQASRRELEETLDRATERLRILVRAAEMTAESAERAARYPELTVSSMRSMLEHSLAAFEQRPELSYLGAVLPANGEYGTLQRTESGDLLLWRFPGRESGRLTQVYRLSAHGFEPSQQLATHDYDPRNRPFYQAALNSVSGDTWLPAYRWIIHAGNSEPLWGITYAKALRDSAGKLICVLDADLDLPALNRFLSPLSAEYRSHFQIVELGDTPRLIGGKSVGRTPLPVPPELAPLLAFSGEVFVDRMQIEAETRWVAARRLTLKGGSTWLVVASRQIPFIESAMRRQLYQVAAIGVVMVAGLVMVSIRITRRFGKPLAELELRVAGIGRRELQAPVAAATFSANDFRETQLLGEALDRMALAVSQLLEAQEQAATSLALKGAIFDSTNTAIISVDPELAIVEWNAAAERLFGRARNGVLGRSVTEIVMAPGGMADWPAILASDGSAAFRFVGASGAFDAELRLLAFKQNGREICTLFLNDVSERKRADAALQESLNRFHAAARATGDVIWDWDLLAKRIWWNENFQLLFGYSAEEIGCDIEFWTTRIHPEDRERVVEHIYAVLEADEENWVEEYRFRRKDGSWADVYDRGHVLRDAGGRGIRMIGAIQDITERKRAEQRIHYLATHDCLTGLPNRELLQDRMAQAVAQARRSGRHLALLYIDLDRFKVVNDGYGHPFGDAVLEAVAARLSALVREGDTVSRQGGDEFLVLLANIGNAGDAYRVAQKIVRSLDCPLDLQSRQIHLSASIGISVFPEDGETAEQLIDNADVAMYRAKELGRNTCKIFTREMSEQTLRRVALETRLRGAQAAAQLHLFYQPKVCLQSGRITGCEALLRWRHPELGMVSPTDFIPIAEDSGLIVPIGDWVLRQACLQVKTWTEAGLPPVCVAVNVSTRQFLQQDVVAWVLRTLEETGLPPAQLELELTESLVAQDVNKVIESFSRLRAAGVKLSIDDFGTGYSSLGYLKRLRAHTLKIDQSFVRDMLTDPEDATIVLAVIALAHNLEYRVIAEGVETERHCRFLRQNGCDEIQGYVFSKPVPAEEFAALLGNGACLSQD